MSTKGAAGGNRGTRLKFFRATSIVVLTASWIMLLGLFIAYPNLNGQTELPVEFSSLAKYYSAQLQSARERYGERLDHLQDMETSIKTLPEKDALSALAGQTTAPISTETSSIPGSADELYMKLEAKLKQARGELSEDQVASLVTNSKKALSRGDVAELNEMLKAVTAPQYMRHIAAERLSRHPVVVISNHRENGYVSGVITDTWKTAALRFELEEAELPTTIRYELRRWDIRQSGIMKVIILTIVAVIVGTTVLETRLTKALQNYDENPSGNASVMDDFRKYLSLRRESMLIKRNKLALSKKCISRRYIYSLPTLGELGFLMVLLLAISAPIVFGVYANPRPPPC